MLETLFAFLHTIGVCDALKDVVAGDDALVDLVVAAFKQPCARVVRRCKLDPGLKSTTQFQKFDCEKG